MSSSKDIQRSNGGTALADAKPKLKKPALYKVVLVNDDYTPMDFVVHILQRVFYKTTEEATAIMLKVHHEGKGICGVYPKEVAISKSHQVVNEARANQH